MKSKAEEVASMVIELRPAELVAQWKRCGLTADWMSSYLVQAFEPSAQPTAQNVLSTVINELLENAVKFSTDDAPAIRIRAGRHGDLTWIETFNTAAEPRARFLEKRLEELAREPMNALFARSMASERDSEAPGIGLVIIQRDHGARIHAELTPRADGAVDVRVRVELDAARMGRE
jgi:hypothetical protein